MREIFTEFSEFRESDKSLKHEFGSIERYCPSHVLCWRCSSMLVSHTRGGWGSNPFAVMAIFLSLNLENSLKTFRKNSNVSYFLSCSQEQKDLLDPS